MEYTKSEAKQWAKKNVFGLENGVYPSFTPDLTKLDEEGIRWDVQQSIKNGFGAICASAEVCGMSFQERKQFVKIVCEEAKGKIRVTMPILQDTVQQDIEMLHHFEQVGGTLVMLGHPMQYYPRSVEDLYREYKYVCDATNIGVVFYPGRIKTKNFHPSGFPVSLISRIAEIPNVVALKIPGGSSDTLAANIFHLVGDKILVADPNPDRWAITVLKYGQQWAGAGSYDQFQTPENPRIVKYFELLTKGKVDEALSIFWELTPIQEASFAAVQIAMDMGMVNTLADKYWQWCNGGNGGMIRQPAARLHYHQKQIIREGLKATGLTPREPEEEFYVGRLNYAKGLRLAKY